MMKIDWKKKLSSRKFWAAAAAFVVSVMIAFNADSESQEKVTGVIAAAGTVCIYMLSESKVDAAGVAAAKEESEGEER